MHCNRKRSSIQDLWYHRLSPGDHGQPYSAPAEMATSSARIACAEQILRSAPRSHASQTRSYRTRRTIPWAARGARAIKASNHPHTLRKSRERFVGRSQEWMAWLVRAMSDVVGSRSKGSLPMTTVVVACDAGRRSARAILFRLGRVKVGSAHLRPSRVSVHGCTSCSRATFFVSSSPHRTVIFASKI